MTENNVASTFSPRLPAPRIAPAVEAGDHHDPMLLNLEEYSVGKAPHSRTATAPVDDRELQRMFRYCLNRRFDRQRETLPSAGRMLSYHARASSKSSFASGIQTTGIVTVS
jgi:hypothetical protein